MSFYEIPLNAGAQTFTVNLGGTQFRMTFVFRNAVGGGWFFDMEKVDGTDEILGIPLLVGIDLLAQHEHKGFGHLLALLDGGQKGDPTYEDMGTALHLYWNPETWNTISG